MINIERRSSMQQPENVILFPKWRNVLEEESLAALKARRFEEALEKLNQLLSYQVNSYEIISGKLICLIELGRYKEAQEICEDVLQQKDKYYYHYLHIYLTVLFQTNQYDLLMEQVEEEFEKQELPALLKEQFDQLYEMSNKMKADVVVEHTTVYLDDLEQAIAANDYQKQWHLIEELRRTKSEPTRNVLALLAADDIHPVIKTAIIVWLQDIEYKETVEIHKWGKNIQLQPQAIGDIHNHTLARKILLLISDLEQKNPTLYELLKQLLYHYIYVRFPILPANKEAESIATALKTIGTKYLNSHDKLGEEQRNINDYIEEIEQCETLYSSVIEES